MSQDAMIKLECSACKKLNYRSRKNKNVIKNRLLLKKFCPTCGNHQEHKETK